MASTSRKQANRTITQLKEGLARAVADRDSWRRCVIEVFSLDKVFTDDPEGISIAYSEDGHSGPGWYAWSDDYPDEGSLFLGSETAKRPSAAAPGGGKERGTEG